MNKKHHNELTRDLFGEIDFELKKKMITTMELKKKEEKQITKELKKKIEKEERAKEPLARKNDQRDEDIDQDKEKVKLINKNLTMLAQVKIKSLQPKELKEFERLEISVTEKEMLQIMTLLALSWSMDGDLAKKDIHLFFDDQCNFLHEAEFALQDGPNAPMQSVDGKIFKMLPYDPFSCLYKWFSYVDPEVLKEHSQVKIFISLFDAIEACGGEFNDVEEWRFGLPIKQKKIKKLLSIGETIYPIEFKEILKACTYYVDDKSGPHIKVSDKNGILLLKINHRVNVFTDDIYIRDEVIGNFLYGGLIIEALGTFTHKTPKMLHQFLDHNPTFLKPARITTSMRWDDPRTIKKTRQSKSNSKSYRETVEEYTNRHNQLAYAWNDGLFGTFKVDVKTEYFALEWKYPNFFIIDPIEDIVNDYSSIIGDLLDPYEGNRYPDTPNDLNSRSWHFPNPNQKQ